MSFSKPVIFRDYNGRPIIYESKDSAKELLNKTEWWRIVTYKFERQDNNYNIIDWTHEREWRVLGDLEFDDYSNIHIILYNPDCTNYFLKECPKNILEKISGITTLTSLSY